MPFVVFYILFYILFCDHLLSNVFVDMLCCSIESCGIVCMLSICGQLFRVFHRWSKEVVWVVLEWVLFYPLINMQRRTLAHQCDCGCHSSHFSHPALPCLSPSTTTPLTTASICGNTTRSISFSSFNSSKYTSPT